MGDRPQHVDLALSGLTKGSPTRPEAPVKFRQRSHLPGQPPTPQRAKPLLLCYELPYNRFNILAPKGELAGDCTCQFPEVYVTVFGQVPEIIQVTRFVPGSVDK